MLQIDYNRCSGQCIYNAPRTCICHVQHFESIPTAAVEFLRYCDIANTRNQLPLTIKRGYSSVAEHSTADREVAGSTPAAPCFKKLLSNSNADLFTNHIDENRTLFILETPIHDHLKPFRTIIATVSVVSVARLCLSVFIVNFHFCCFVLL